MRLGSCVAGLGKPGVRVSGKVVLCALPGTGAWSKTFEERPRPGPKVGDSGDSVFTRLEEEEA
jgi:hypothetical protein